MAQRIPTTTAALNVSDRQQLARALKENDDVTIFVNGTAVKLPPTGTAAVVDLIKRLTKGDAVMVSSVTEMLTTSQAAEAAGISHTYLRNLTNAGVIPVEYRGTHRRIRLTDITSWLDEQKSADHHNSETAQ
ncbi:helix-turn-helix domain-containing protein [Arthrobacter roseus]|uniref:helix-turn-helix domain-containing protein n=1 Tax=Arthrobacter roseus TaxID=136274 RepID=UPI001962DA3B|nr:helix-turn-helix domain-containing protein [Arthrobacter roseus]MBM7847014.1 excisionase family DNA binding protein [Arthrobacter roseus]